MSCHESRETKCSDRVFDSLVWSLIDFAFPNTGLREFRNNYTIQNYVVGHTWNTRSRSTESSTESESGMLRALSTYMSLYIYLRYYYGM